MRGVGSNLALVSNFAALWSVAGQKVNFAFGPVSPLPGTEPILAI